MRIVSVFSTMSSIAVAVTLSWLIALCAVQPVNAYDPVGAEFLPGSVVTQHMACDWYQRQDNGKGPLCYFKPLPDEPLWVSYYVQSHQIVHASMLVTGKTAGDLVLAWGDPGGYTKVAGGLYLYWQNRYAYVTGEVFSPGSPVGYIAFSADLNFAHPWSGFVNIWGE